MDDPGLARAYYRHIDGGEYDALGDLLADGFRQVRPDRTIEGRDAFVRFMRDERPMTDTSHHVDALYAGEAGVAVEGRLVRTGGGELFGFVDAFRFDGDRIAGIHTYTD